MRAADGSVSISQNGIGIGRACSTTQGIAIKAHWVSERQNQDRTTSQKVEVAELESVLQYSQVLIHGRCIVCRTGRVKCDQQRPICGRSERWICGYFGPRSTFSNPHLHPLFSKSEHCTRSSFPHTITHSLGPITIVIQHPARLPVLPTRQQQSSHHSIALIPRLTIDTPDFSSLCLREDNPSSRNCYCRAWVNTETLSSAANITTFASSWNRSGRMIFSGLRDRRRAAGSRASVHYGYAPEQYGTAAKRMLEDVVPGRSKIRVLLLICVVTTCFELMYVNHEAACSQIRHSQSLFLWCSWWSKN